VNDKSLRKNGKVTVCFEIHPSFVQEDITARETFATPVFIEQKITKGACQGFVNTHCIMHHQLSALQVENVIECGLAQLMNRAIGETCQSTDRYS
jgi:hypothetical protein